MHAARGITVLSHDRGLQTTWGEARIHIIYLHTHTHTYAHIHTHTHKRIHPHPHTHMNAHTHTHLHTPIRQTRRRMHERKYVHTQTGPKHNKHTGNAHSFLQAVIKSQTTKGNGE